MTRASPAKAAPKKDASVSVAIDDALDFFEGKTVAQIAIESAVPTRIVKRVLDGLHERGLLERNGNKYRITNDGAPWKAQPKNKKEEET